MKRCQAVCITEGHEGHRCTAERLPYKTGGLWLCWTHAAAKENPNRSQELTIVTEAPC